MIDVNALQSFTDTDLLKLYRYAIATGAAGQTRTINGRTIIFPPLKDMLTTISWLESRIQSASDASGGNVVFAQFNQPT